jgi:biopolymer transport protein ExbD
MVVFIPVLTVGALLVFFVLLGGTFLLQPGISVRVPTSPFLLAPQRNPKVVAITSAPVPGIFYDNMRVNADQLATMLDASTGVSSTLVIKADRLAPVELVVQVFTMATDQGYNVVLATAEPE